jgi:hypothetical protein
MDLITQFPDISMKIRERARIKQTDKIAKPARPVVTYSIDQTRAQMHDREFRRWHLKLFILMIITLVGVYLMVLNSPWMFNLINTVRI